MTLTAPDREQTDLRSEDERVRLHGPTPSRLLLAILAGLLAAGAVAVGLHLSVEARRLAATNSKVLASGVAVHLEPGATRCQGGEYVPSTAAWVRVYADPAQLPHRALRLVVFDGERAVASAQARGFSAGALDMELLGPRHDVHRGTACLTNEGDGPVALAGNLTSASPDAVPAVQSPGARPGEDEVRIDYYRAGSESRWAVLTEVVRRHSLFRPDWLRGWSLLGGFALAGVSGLLALVILCRPRQAASLKRALPLLFVIALLNGLSWALVMPVFQGPDEPVHFGYADYLAERGELPGSVYVSRKRELAKPAGSEHWKLYSSLPFNVESVHVWSEYEDQALREALAAEDHSRSDWSAPGAAAGSPPLYYLPLAAVSAVLADSSIIDRVFALRFVSAALASLTVVFSFLFAREVFPASPQVWWLAGLGVAFQPVFASLAGTIINDTLMLGFAAALLFMIARSFRKGLTPRRAGAAALLLVLGDLTKSRMLILLPVVVLAFAVLVLREREHRFQAARAAGVGIAVFAALESAWYVISKVMLERGTGLERAAGEAGQATSFGGLLSYLWQYFFPRLPWMEDQFTRYPDYGVWEVYIQGFIGRFGYFQYGFGRTANIVGLIILCVLSGLALASLLRSRRAVRKRGGELLTYLAVVAGLVALVGFTGYHYRASTGYNLEQTRYLFPALALYGGMLGLAVKAMPPTLRSVTAVLIGFVAFAHMMASLFLTVDRYFLWAIL